MSSKSTTTHARESLSKHFNSLQMRRFKCKWLSVQSAMLFHTNPCIRDGLQKKQSMPLSACQSAPTIHSECLVGILADVGRFHSGILSVEQYYSCLSIARCFVVSTFVIVWAFYGRGSRGAECYNDSEWRLHSLVHSRRHIMCMNSL